ncbi:MAG: selenide, water dikinase SelD, partial [Halioglobus sp.]|nr:selenide, water dikinase SelD [Halioglobus sp.]
SALPLLPGARDAMGAGYRSTMHAANEESAAHSERGEGAIDDDLRAMLYDPQTCGGLLIAIAPGHAGALLEALADADMTEAAVIGAITAREPGPGNALVISQP